jgi:hypothetical protein
LGPRANPSTLALPLLMMAIMVVAMVVMTIRSISFKTELHVIQSGGYLSITQRIDVLSIGLAVPGINPAGAART